MEVTPWAKRRQSDAQVVILRSFDKTVADEPDSSQIPVPQTSVPVAQISGDFPQLTEDATHSILMVKSPPDIGIKAG
jgi:hypothetical protein